MSDERKRCSDVTPDDVDGRVVDRWPVGYTTVIRSEYSNVPTVAVWHPYAPDPLDDLMAIRGCIGTP